MAIRPQCSRIVMTFNKESAYGTAVADGSITKLYEPNEPSLLEHTRERVTDADLIKGHEFPVDNNLDFVVAEDLSIPFNFPGSLSLIGLLSAFALGNVSVTGINPDFVHTIKIADTCVSDQLASTSWVLGLVGDTASLWLAKGLVINELRIAMNDVGRLEVSGTAIGDGSLTAKSSFSIPTTSSHADWIRGSQADFLTANTGSGVVSKKTKFRGFELTINNNLDVADGRSNFADAGTKLKSLRLGERSISLVVRVEGHQGDEFWTDFAADTLKDVQITVTKSAARSLDIRMKDAKIVSAPQSFDSIRDVLELTYEPHFTAADSTPLTITVKNGDAAYLV